MNQNYPNCLPSYIRSKLSNKTSEDLELRKKCKKYKTNIYSRNLQELQNKNKILLTQKKDYVYQNDNKSINLNS